MIIFLSFYSGTASDLSRTKRLEARTLSLRILQGKSLSFKLENVRYIFKENIIVWNITQVNTWKIAKLEEEIKQLKISEKEKGDRAERLEKENREIEQKLVCALLIFALNYEFLAE